MVKQLLSSEKSPSVQIHQDNNNPGCMWGLLHILGYHHWHVKKVFTHKKRRHARYKRNNALHNQGGDQRNEVAEAEPFLVRQHRENLSAAGKSYPKNHKKGPESENRFIEENSKGRILSLPGESQPLDSGKNEASSECAVHLEKDGKAKDAAINQKFIGTRPNKLDRDTGNKFKRHNDVLEVFRVEKDLFLKFLRELDVGGKNLHHNKARLTKSGTFPLPSSSHVRSIRSSTLKHKQNEVWAFPKGQKLLDGTKATERSALGFVKDVSYEKRKTLGSDLGADSAMKRKPGVSSSFSHGLHNKGWNQVVNHRFKIIKQKIKHALVEFKKSGYQTSVAPIHHRDSPEYSITNNNEKEASQSIDDGVIQEYTRAKSSNETSASVNVSNRHEARLVRRTSSLNESLDKYSQLFEKSFGTDVKWHSSKSKSLKLTTEDKMNNSGRALKFSRSNFSLPSIESLRFILHEALLEMNDSTDAEAADNHIQRKSVSLPLKIDKSIAHAQETEVTEAVEEAEISEVVGEIDEVVASESFRQENEEISMTIHPIEEVMASLESTIREDNTTGHAEGRELDTQGSSMEELTTELPSTGSLYSLPSSLPNTDAGVTAEDTANKSPENHSLLFKSDTDNDSNFKYVKAILQSLGSMGNEQTQMHHRIDQSLKPSLQMDLDASLRQSSGEESIKTYDHQLLLLNLVNEVLLEMHEMSPTYFPRPFNFNYRLRPMPKGEYLLKEVWGSVNSYLSLRPELDQTLDDVVGRDLAKRSGWMNLQQEEEYVALELEEMIMDDLLDEIIFS